MADIRPVDLPPAASVPVDAAIIVDNGLTVEKATPLQVVDAARPLASQADAETGIDNAKIMSPLRVKQAIDAQVRVPFASSAGAGGIGSDDGAGGALWTTVAGFIAKLLSSAGSSVIGFIQAGTGAVARTVQSRLRDTVNVKDFGALGDGTTNDNAAMVAAQTASSDVYWPAGTYVLNAAPDITKSWGPGICMVGGSRVYLRPTAEPAQEIFAEIFGLANDGVTSDSAALQRAIDYAQSLRLPVKFPKGGSLYLSTGLTMKQGRAASGDPFIYSANIDFNGCTIYPGNGVMALDIVPRCLLADASTSRGAGGISWRGGVTFDGSKGNTSSKAFRIGRAGYHCSPFDFGLMSDVLIQLFSNTTLVGQVVETRHMNFNRVVIRAGFIEIVSVTAGAFAGDMTWDSCEFTGSANNLPLRLRADNSTGTGAAAVVRGVRFNSCVMYGPLTAINSVGIADVGDIWFSNPQFEGPYDGTTGGRAIDITAVGASARVFAVFLDNPYFSGLKGPAVYARPGSGGDIRAIHISNPDCAAFTISAATAIDGNCNAVFAMVGVRGFQINGGTLNSIVGDTNTVVANIQNATNGTVTGLNGANFTGISAGIVAGGTSDIIAMTGNLLPVTSANVAANFGSGTQFVIANNLKVT